MAGHRKGADKLLEFVSWCQEAGVESVTAYVFSTENFNRSPKEVDGLFALIEERLPELETETKEGGRKVRLKLVSSDPERLPPSTLETLQRLERRSELEAAETALKKDGEKSDHQAASRVLTLNLCVAYGAWGEVAGACRRIAGEVSKGELKPEAVDETLLRSRLLTADTPPLDMVIRTGGDRRLSNFMLLQSAYAELYFCPKYWPEFTREDLELSFEAFRRSERRFGK